ncbi:hypothetical protein AWC38_SpisGene6446 [Stylophora pistillata]|uniref:Uncharacterized protein n=1 Tax=Stylophora pistillata TaxID=50429 RepID=A0A2B4SDR6_STYPI|nr:hypothetical protein AWC38_SpisGene6446 [Stylophora pistillata]
MDLLKELMIPKTLSKLRIVTGTIWIVIESILSAIFIYIETSESKSDIRCDEKFKEKAEKDLVLEKCWDEYRKEYSKFALYGFVLINFFVITMVSITYSQCVRSKVDELERQLPERQPLERHSGRGLSTTYCCQLAAIIVLAILFIVFLQTQVFRLSLPNFSSNFECHLSKEGSSSLAFSSKNATPTKPDIYACHNTRAAEKAGGRVSVTVFNGICAFFAFFELVQILLQAMNDEQFMKDSQFYARHLRSSQELEPQQNQVTGSTQDKSVTVVMPTCSSQEQQPGKNGGTESTTRQQGLYHNKVISLASLPFKGLATKHTTIKWTIAVLLSQFNFTKLPLARISLVYDLRLRVQQGNFLEITRMDSFRGLIVSRTLSTLIFVTTIIWDAVGGILFFTFLYIENSESTSDIRCDADLSDKGGKDPAVLERCFDEYQKEYNKFPVFGFVLINFFIITLVLIIYSQTSKSKIDALETRNPDVEGRQGNVVRRGLFAGYCCQLAVIIVLAILFIILLQITIDFPSKFECNLSKEGSNSSAFSSTNASPIKPDIYACRNTRAAKRAGGSVTITVLNGIYIFIASSELLWILSRARNDRRFKEDSQFYVDHLRSNRDREPQPQQNEMTSEEPVAVHAGSTYGNQEQQPEKNEGTESPARSERMQTKSEGQSKIDMAIHPGEKQKVNSVNTILMPRLKSGELSEQQRSSPPRPTEKRPDQEPRPQPQNEKAVPTKESETRLTKSAIETKFEQIDFEDAATYPSETTKATFGSKSRELSEQQNSSPP